MYTIKVVAMGILRQVSKYCQADESLYIIEYMKWLYDLQSSDIAEYNELQS